MGHEYEMADYNRNDLIFTKEMLLAEPIERTPLRREGRVTPMVEVAFFAGAIGALGGAIAVIALRNPFYSVLALIVHLISLAGLFLMLHAEFIAAAQIVVYAGAVMVLYVFVAAYVGGVEEPIWEPIPGQRFLAPAARRGAVHRGLDRGRRHLADVDRRPRGRRSRSASARRARSASCCWSGS